MLPTDNVRLTDKVRKKTLRVKIILYVYLISFDASLWPRAHTFLSPNWFFSFSEGLPLLEDKSLFLAL